MKAYCGIRVYMSIVVLPETSMYWSTDWLFGNFFLSNIMTRDRFDKISQYLHCCDSTLNPKHGEPNHDQLHHVRNIMDIISEACLRNYNPHREQTVDEAMIKFRGRLSFKQYVPMKPTKYGIKVWCRADPTDGYLHQFQVYTGKPRGGRGEVGMKTRVVMDLAELIKGHHHIITADNYFMSVSLASRLLQQQTYCRGTIDKTRKGFPWSTLSRSQLDTRGDFKVLQDGDIMACAWVDKKVVTFISSYDQANRVSSVERKVADGSKVEVPCPPVVAAYNINMNGVDRADQIRTQYSTFRSSRRWWLYLFWFLFDVAITNGFILMKKSLNHVVKTRNGNVVDRKLLSFRMNLAKQLISNVRVQRKRSAQTIDPTGNSHFIRSSDRKARCKQCSFNNLRREPKWICSSCKVHLCVDCFEPYHRRMQHLQQEQ